MDRRKFLQTISVMGTTTILSGSTCSAKASVIRAIPTSGTKNTVRNCVSAKRPPRIGVVAVGRTGGEILTRLNKKLPYVECSMAIDGDLVALNSIVADRKILLNEADVEATLRIAEAVSGLDIAFVVTGTDDVVAMAIFPLVAKALRRQHVMTIGAPITPSDFDGLQQHQNIVTGAITLCGKTDAVYPIVSKSLIGNYPLTAATTFERLYKGITTPFAKPGLVNIDLEDIRWLLSRKGESAIGFGSACGTDAVDFATTQAITHPLLGTSHLCDVSAILVSIEGRSGLIKLREVSKIMNIIRDTAPESLLIFGATVNENMFDDFRVTIMTSGRLLEA